MSSKLLLVASISLAQHVSEAEVHYGYSGDPNQVGYARDRGLSWAGWHHIAGIPQWVTAWGFVALFIGIVAVFIKCGKEDFNLYPKKWLGYLKYFGCGLFCALPCLWPIVCLLRDRIRKKIAERRQLNLDAFERGRRRRRGLDQESEPANNNPAVRQTDPEALPDYPDHPPATLPDYPYQTILPDHPDQTGLPDYTDHPSPSAPPAEFATGSAAEIAAEEARAAADAREAAAAAAALAAAEAAVAAAAKSGENEFEAPPSYDAAMRGEF